MKTTLKLNEIIAEWISECDILPATKQDYERKIALWFRWLAGRDIDTRAPERTHVLEYKQRLQAAGKSVYTVNSLVTILKLFYSFCERRGYYDNIATGIKSSKRHTEYSKLPLTAEQAFELLGSIDGRTAIDRRDRLMISLMLFNGLRTCEVERINIGDFSTREGEPILYIQRKGRTDKNEIVVLHANTVEWLEEYISDRDFAEGDPLFISHKRRCDNRIVRQTIGRIVKERLLRIGIRNPKISAHSLRHTFGALLVEQGVDIETIKDMMGHSDTRTTRIYIEMAQQRRLLHNSPSREVGNLILKKR
ncbi:MAG: tyrosine-type recombinase/integrase [Alistipes onderdonkii]